MGKIWDKSGQIEWTDAGVQADGALAYFYAGGTTTPITTYSDAAETTPRTHPVVADANGRWPVVFIPFRASYDVKVTTEAGTQLYYYTLIPNADPVEASVDSVDDAELIQTGDIIFSPKTGTRAGFVRCNGRTIGSAASGATERANADTSDLYSFLWDNFSDALCAVATGRGANAAADFAANKAIAVFDLRSGGLLGVDDMGNSAASLGSSATYTTGNATTGGSIGGLNSHTLTTAQLAEHGHTTTATGSVNANDPQHNHPVPYTTTNIQQGSGSTISVVTSIGAGASVPNTTAASTGINPVFVGNAIASTNAGSGSAHNNVQKSLLGNWLMKL